jgi:hypothetical protein
MELEEYSTLLPQVLFDPASHVMISVDGIAISWHLEITLGMKAHLPALITYYQTLSSGTSPHSMQWTGKYLEGSTQKCRVLLLQPPYW